MVCAQKRAKFGLVRPIAQADGVEQAREHYSPDNEHRDANHNVGGRQCQQIAAGEQRQKRFRDLV
jgi:hypothetical protein